MVNTLDALYDRISFWSGGWHTDHLYLHIVDQGSRHIPALLQYLKEQKPNIDLTLDLLGSITKTPLPSHLPWSREQKIRVWLEWGKRNHPTWLTGKAYIRKFPEVPEHMVRGVHCFILANTSVGSWCVYPGNYLAVYKQFTRDKKYRIYISDYDDWNMDLYVENAEQQMTIIDTLHKKPITYDVLQQLDFLPG